MVHNPEKSRTLCVVAKASYWTLAVAGWALLAGMVGLIVIVLPMKAYAAWDWNQIGGAALAILFLAAFFGWLWLIGWGVTSLYAWAKAYREGC